MVANMLLLQSTSSSALVTNVKHADVFTGEDKQKLWSSGVLNLSTPT